LGLGLVVFADEVLEYLSSIEISGNETAFLKALEGLAQTVREEIHIDKERAGVILSMIAVRRYELKSDRTLAYEIDASSQFMELSDLFDDFLAHHKMLFGILGAIVFYPSDFSEKFETLQIMKALAKESLSSEVKDLDFLIRQNLALAATHKTIDLLEDFLVKIEITGMTMITAHKAMSEFVRNPGEGVNTSSWFNYAGKRRN
jgi:hypothetical protein